MWGVRKRGWRAAALGGLAFGFLCVGLSGCESSDQPDSPDAPPQTSDGSVADAAQGADAALGLTDVSADTANTDGSAPDAVNVDAASDVEPLDTTADSEGDGGLNKPFPPLVLGPPYADYDCTNPNAELPGRLSPVPLSCVIDPACSEPMVVGHRAAGGDFGAMAPENSRAAIRVAILMGLDGVELDVRHTSDDVLVLMHDGDVDRTAFGTGNVDALTAAEATALTLRPPPLGVGGDFSCETIPTLAEAIELVRGRMFIDLDTKTSRVDLVVAAIQAADARDFVFVSVSDFDRAAAARAIDPTIRIQVRPDSMEEVLEATAMFDPPPDIYEIESEFAVEAAAHVHPLGKKLFANSWGADGEYYFSENSALYLDQYGAGIDILQSELPPQPLEVLGRWPLED